MERISKTTFKKDPDKHSLKPDPTEPEVEVAEEEVGGNGHRLLQDIASREERQRRRSEEGLPQARYEMAPRQEPQQQERSRSQIQADL